MHPVGSVIAPLARSQKIADALYAGVEIGPGLALNADDDRPTALHAFPLCMESSFVLSDAIDFVRYISKIPQVTAVQVMSEHGTVKWPQRSRE